MFEYDDPRTHRGDWANPEDIVHPDANPFSGHQPTHATGTEPGLRTPVIMEADPEHDPNHGSAHTPCHHPEHAPLYQGRWAEGSTL